MVGKNEPKVNRAWGGLAIGKTRDFAVGIHGLSPEGGATRLGGCDSRIEVGAARGKFAAS